MSCLADRLRREASPFTVRGSLPVLFFGDLLNARVATVGLNPSLREYRDRRGLELAGLKRRFETLASLKATDRTTLSVEQCRRAVETMRGYFDAHRPVYEWFAGPCRVVYGLGYSFRDRTAAHLDLIQESTDPVWGEIMKHRSSVAANLLCADLPFLRWQIETFPLAGILCTSRTVLDNVIELTSAKVIETGDTAGRHWTVAVTQVRDRSVAIAGWNIPLARAPGLTHEQQTELG